MVAEPERDAASAPEERPGAMTSFRAVTLFLLIAGAICFFNLGGNDVIHMEGIVADGARHMDRTRELSVPHLHGEIYAYKPPLAYWMALASFRIFGAETEWTLRFPFASSGLVMGLAVLLATGSVAGWRGGLLCAFASLTGGLMVQKLHLAEFDLPLAAGIGVAVAVACRNLAVDRAAGGWWSIAYLSLAVAFLAKGVPALMFFAPGLVLAALWTGRSQELLRPAHLAGMLLFGAIASGWLVAAYQQAGWQAFTQPYAEAQDKGLGWQASYVLTTLVKPLKTWAMFLPWTLLLPLTFKARWSSKPSQRMAIAAAGFVVAGVAVFMAVPAAESRYLLPLTAPIGILCGLSAKQIVTGNAWRGRVVKAFAAIIGAAAVAQALLDADMGTGTRLEWIGLGALVLAALYLRRRDRSWQAAAQLVAVVALASWWAQVRVIEPHRAAERSLRAVAADFEAHLAAVPEIWVAPVSKDFRHSSLFFYLRRPVKTFTADGGGPPAGRPFVLFSDEHRELMAAAPSDFEILERVSHRDIELILARARGPQAPTAARR